MGDDLRAELSALSRAVRAHLEEEADLGNDALPPFTGDLPPPPARTPELPPQAAAAPPPPDIAAGAITRQERDRRLAELTAQARDCRACVLHEKRTKNVFARGSADAELVFVGEGPGRDEDLQGLPFVGRAGQLLDRMIAAMGFSQDQIYICNVVKCRPPDNRTPRPDEALACSRFLKPQVALVAPKVIVALGRCAAENLGVAPPEGRWRGRWGTYEGVPVMPTYHPAFLLRSPQFKRVVWEDLQQVMGRFGKQAPAREG